MGLPVTRVEVGVADGVATMKTPPVVLLGGVVLNFKLPLPIKI